MVKESTTSAEEDTTKQEQDDAIVAQEMEATLRRLVNAVFDLQKDISRVDEKITKTNRNVESLRDQFQDFAEKTQDQLGVMIPAKQFMTDDENLEAEIEADIKALEKEIKSVEQLQDHIGQRHSSGVMPKEAFDEESKKLEEKLEKLYERLKKKREEISEIPE